MIQELILLHKKTGIFPYDSIIYILRAIISAVSNNFNLVVTELLKHSSRLNPHTLDNHCLKTASTNGNLEIVTELLKVKKSGNFRLNY
jgi:hypothetical protein